MVEIRDHQTSTVKLSAPSVSSPLDTPRVPSVAMSVYIATMTHTAVTFSILQDWLAGRVAGLGLERDAMMPGVRPNATSRPGRPHSQRGIMDERGQPLLPCEGLASVETGEKVAFASDAQMKQNTRCVSNDKGPALLRPDRDLSLVNPRKRYSASELKVDSNWRGRGRGGGEGALLQGHALALDQ